MCHRRSIHSHQSYLHSHCASKMVCLYMFKLIHKAPRVDRFVRRILVTKSLQTTTTTKWVWNSTWLNENSSKCECIENSEHKIKKSILFEYESCQSISRTLCKIVFTNDQSQKVEWQHIKADTKRILFISAMCKGNE